MKKNFLISVFFISLLCYGCAAKYSMRASQSPKALQWPFAPAKPKITYIQSVNGFSRGKDSGFAFRAIAGSGAKENDMFLLPVAIATGNDGRIAVADLGRQCIHLYLPANQKYFRLLGSNKAKIISPVGVVFDEALNLYVTDSVGKIYSFTSTGDFRAVWSKANEQTLMRPTGIAYSAAKKLLYVVDTLANKIYAFNTDGKVMLSFGKRGEEPGDFNFPTHIFSTNGYLYITDSLNFRVQLFNESGGFVSSFGHHGDGSGDMAMPKGVAADQDGVIYVVDSLFDNVQLFDATGKFLLTIGARGTDFGEFWLPAGAYIHGSTLYVCDTYNHRIQVFQITEHFS